MTGSTHDAMMSISLLNPSVGCCWRAETCTWYLAVWLVERVFSREEETLPLTLTDPLAKQPNLKLELTFVLASLSLFCVDD